MRPVEVLYSAAVPTGRLTNAALWEPTAVGECRLWVSLESVLAHCKIGAAAAAAINCSGS